MFSNVWIPGLIIIILLALIFFGPSKPPIIGKAVGTSLREFKNAAKGVSAEIKEEIQNKMKLAKKDSK
ncbi:twin-arginine translocase TatA/TatE family subunit [Bacillus massiliglaciei]|uniref:twin-arginine translocase TatA/TatE family subunit n=1 Tax=Bacillus massiliglaciei TaxID=1816693 RepID=UPI000DA62F7A|nr:twin-arginine translocase TatA/TatE family subunit [Bacillus massiliglaciei]